MSTRLLAGGGLIAGILLSVQPWAEAQKDNGIAVGKPKIFDNRTLTLMLDSLDQSLRAVQVIDQTKLAQSLGLLQGYTSESVSRSFQVSTLPLPGSTTTLKPDSTGKLVPADQTVTEGAFTPTAPTLPTAPAALAFNPQFGTSAGDLLNDQVNLTYQIFNLRMLLDRSLSDRLWLPVGQTGKPEAPSTGGARF